MLNKQLTLILFAIILIEGFFTLSMELLVIRQTIPFVGNGTEMVSIIISSVLMPLAFGYSYGGKRYSEMLEKHSKTKIRNILSKNIYIIVALTGVGFSYIVMALYFQYIPIDNLMISLSIYLFFFLAIPTFLLGQTVPLISNYFSSKEMSRITGKILFLSTAGSFAGSVITVLISMRFIGVSNTLIVIEGLLLFLIFLISKNKLRSFIFISLIMSAIIGLKLLSDSAFNIEYENRYSTVSIKEDANNRKHLIVNNSFSSETNKDNTAFFPYVNTINNLLKDETNKRILVIGAGGFTVGLNDNNNEYVYVDIDSDLKKLVEDKFINTKIGKNKIFEDMEVRKYLNEGDNKFDIIVVDAYTNKISIPASLVTTEFYKQLKESLNTDGYIVSNVVIDVFLKTKFSKAMDNTIRQSFNSVVVLPVLNTEKDKFPSLSNDKPYLTNNIYIMRDTKEEKFIYTDDKNTCTFDR